MFRYLHLRGGWMILDDVSGGTAVWGWVCAESNGWKMFCESVVKVTKAICKMTGANPETGVFDL